MDESDYEAVIQAALERELAAPDEDGNVMPVEQQAELLAVLREMPSVGEMVRERERPVIEQFQERAAQAVSAWEQVVRLAQDADGPGRPEIVWRDPAPR